MKSDTHNWLGRSALNCRLTRSSGQTALASPTVVRTTLPRLMPFKPERPHQPLDRTAGHSNALALKLVPDLMDLGEQSLIHLGTRTAQFGVALLASMAVIALTGQSAELCRWARPRRYRGAVLVNESSHDLSRRSSSADAKKALASLRISLARRSSLTSRSGP